MTFPISLGDHASTDNFPLESSNTDFMMMLKAQEEKPEDDLVANLDCTRYEEAIYVGYRHFDKNSIRVSYPFGFGLSYTGFEFDNMEVTVVNDTVYVGLNITNTGDLEGKEVVQVYTSKPDTRIDRPVQELKAFAKTPLLPGGASFQLIMSFPVSELRYWDDDSSEWKLEEGEYIIRAGASSRDIRLNGEISL